MLSYVTAYQQIHRVGELKEGQSCLIVGGSGAVGDAVLQLCQVAGIQCFATGSERHHARFKSFGAIPLPRSAKDWLPLVTGKMDLVIDGVCEDGFDSSYAARNATGKLSAMGLSHPIAANLGTWYIVKKFIGAKINSRSTFYSIGDYRKANPVEFQQDLTAVYDLILQSKITPDIKKIVNFAQVSALHADMEAGKLVGKYVLDPWLVQTATAAPSAPVAE
jgi:NADPH:quinone reductase-like Zn-dependent oxidoreductase